MGVEGTATASNVVTSLNLDLIESVVTRGEVGWKTHIGDELRIGRNIFRVTEMFLEKDFEGNESVRVRWVLK